MKVSTVVVLQFNDDLTEATKIVDVSYQYDSGPVAECKKGREANQANTQFQQEQAKKNAGNADTSYNTANNVYQSEANLTPGGMSSPAAAIYASDRNRINNVYNGLRSDAFASAGIRGFGNAPSGFAKSTQNALDLGQANADQNAYNSGIVETQRERENAAAGETALHGQSISTELGNTNAANTSAFNQSQMGSTLGDVLGGASSILGGLSGFGAIGSSLGKMFPKSTSNVGSYGGSWNVS
jgi:hypothetical protein